MKRRHSAIGHVICAIVLGAAAPHLASAQNPAADVWIQSFVSPSISSVLLGLSWGRLDFAANSIGFDLRQFDGSAPIGPSLFYFREPGEQLTNGPYSLPVGVTLTANTTYGIVIERNAGGIGTGNSPASTFPNGSFYVRIAGEWVKMDNDMTGFAVNFGPTTVTPEPSTLSLFAMGLVVLVIATRRRHAIVLHALDPKGARDRDVLRSSARDRP